MRIRSIAELEPEMAGIRIEGELVHVSEARRVQGENAETREAYDFYSQFIALKDGDSNEDSIGVSLTFGHEEEKLPTSKKGYLVQIEKCRIHDYQDKDKKNKRGLRANRSDLSFVEPETKEETKPTSKPDSPIKDNGIWEEKDLKIVRMNANTNATNLLVAFMGAGWIKNEKTAEKKLFELIEKLELNTYRGMEYPIGKEEEPEKKEPITGKHIEEIGEEEPITGGQAEQTLRLIKENSLTNEEATKIIMEQCNGKDDIGVLNYLEANTLILYLLNMIPKQGG